ncbi:MAG: CDP-alcohol phosphatidyltransferase family protein [Eubacterium sp.]|nr:CDP-alcohol phosphatidyltransferase family protein [Eubacterium sp.]
MANIITGTRIICSIALLFCPALSVAFYLLYIIAGISDMIDGTIARKTCTVSEFGSTLDTVADFIFVVICMIKLLPILDIAIWVFIWIGIIAIIKVINIVSGIIVQGNFVSVHSVMNKITGCLLFLLPFTVGFVELRYSVVVVCVAATLAAIQEGHYIKTGRYEKSNRIYKE